MISISLIFIVVAGIAFLGFIINALFSKIRIANVLPLMVIGLLLGPVFHIVNVGQQSTIVEITPIVTAITIAFILFDIGLNIDINKLTKIFSRATAFSFAVSIVTGAVISVVAYFTLGWGLIFSLIFGFALASPSSIIVPTLVKLINAGDELKETLVYESVITDIVSLIVPLSLFAFIAGNSTATATYIGSFVFTTIFGAILIGVVAALFWLYALNRFWESSRGYRWVLTITMIIATYGIASLLGLNEAIAVFIFGVTFATIGTYNNKNENSAARKNSILRYFSVGSTSIRYIKDFQKEIVFFTSAFFFVYIGLLFNISQIYLLLILVAIVAAFVMIVIRVPFIRLIRKYLSEDKTAKKAEEGVIAFDIPRGRSPAVIATIPLTLGIVIPNFLNLIFLVILITNVIATIGIFVMYKPKQEKKTGK